MNTASNKQYHINHWVFHPEEKLLRHNDGHDVKLEDKIAKLLLTFCIHRGQLISKESIIAAVWDGRELSEQTIPVAISKLRKALGDDINKPQMLETIPRQGYRLRAEKVVNAEPLDKPPMSRRAYSLAAGCLILLVSGLFIAWEYSTPPANRIQVANAEKPGIIVTINDVRTTEDTKDKIDQAIAISELSSFFLAQVPDLLVIRHWWNLDAPDPTGGIYTRYGNATPVYSLKATLLKEEEGNLVTFILSNPQTDEIIWTGIHRVKHGSKSLFSTLSSMLARLTIASDDIEPVAPEEDLNYWNARYYMQLSTPGTAQVAFEYLQKMTSANEATPAQQSTRNALISRWNEHLKTNTDEPAAFMPSQYNT